MSAKENSKASGTAAMIKSWHQLRPSKHRGGGQNCISLCMSSAHTSDALSR